MQIKVLLQYPDFARRGYPLQQVIEDEFPLAEVVIESPIRYSEQADCPLVLVGTDDDEDVDQVYDRVNVLLAENS